jgi:hypothetical protein
MTTPTLSIEEYFEGVMASIGMTYYTHDFKKIGLNAMYEWNKSYDEWFAKGCPPIDYKIKKVEKPAPKQYRYLNRV